MAENLAINYERRVIGTKDGYLYFGHIHGDEVKSSIMLQGQEALEYITIDQLEPRKRWITSRCRGRYQVKCGDDIPKEKGGMWFNADRSDILIQTKGRIRMEAENIDLIATGIDTKTGIVNILGNESVNIETKKCTINTSETISFFTDGVMQQVASNILRTYAGYYEKMSGKSSLKPPLVSISKNILDYATKSLAQ